MSQVFEEEEPIDRGGDGTHDEGNEHQANDNERAAANTLGNSCSNHFAFRKDINERQVIAVGAYGGSTFRAEPPVVLLRCQAMMTQRDRVILIECFVNLLSPRVRRALCFRQP